MKFVMMVSISCYSNRNVTPLLFDKGHSCRELDKRNLPFIVDTPRAVEVMEDHIYQAQVNSGNLINVKQVLFIVMLNHHHGTALLCISVQIFIAISWHVVLVLVGLVLQQIGCI